MDLFAVLASERRRLADELERLKPEDWVRPSLCEGWSNHVVAAHLNMPWAVSRPAFVARVLRNRGSIDRAMDGFSREVAGRLAPKDCVAGLREHADNRFAPPGIGVAAPLTDVIVHGQDILRPLRRAHGVSADALRAALVFLTTRKAVLAFGARPAHQVTLEATDLDLRIGAGDRVVAGPGLALCGVLLGRDDLVSEVAGDGLVALGYGR